MDVYCSVQGQKLRIETPVRHFSRSSEDFVRFLFDFSADWEGLTVFAQFRQGGSHSDKYLTEVTVPTEDGEKTYAAVTLPGWPKAGPLSLLLYGTGNETVIGTTNYVLMHIDETGLIDADVSDMDETLYQQLINRIVGVETQLRKTAQVYASAADMAEDKTLTNGLTVATEGRWEPNDGGARTYLITNTDIAYSTKADGNIHNPLAIEVASGMYAIPIIGDHVTALDIGLRRGIYGDNPPFPDDLSRSVYSDQTNIAAQNSKKLQNYIDNLPDYTSADNTDGAGANAPMRSIFIPVGIWGFRDPIILGDGVTVYGVPRGTYSRGYDRGMRSISYNDDDTAFSRLIFMGRELCVASNGAEGTVATAFASSLTGTRVIVSTTPGDQTIDPTAIPPRTATQCIEYSFIYAGAHTMLKDLDICGYDNYYWSNAEDTIYNPKATNDNPIPYTADDWSSMPGTRDQNDPGGAHYCYHTFRKQRKISGITHATPQRDVNGKIVVNNTGAVELVWSGWMQVDGCDFYQWSRAAIRACVVDRIKNCVFAYNHIGIEMVSHDLWIMDVYISRGDIGIMSKTHTTTVSNSFIDFMAEFGVCTERTNDIVRVVGSGDKRWVKREGYHFKGYLLVDYDIAIEFCQLGAYAAQGIVSKTTIRGKLVNNGLLYCKQHTRIASKLSYQTHVDELKVTDAMQNHSDELDDTSLIWNEIQNKWVTGTATEEIESLKQYHENNAAVFRAYEAISEAHIVLEATSLAYYGIADVDEEALADIAEAEAADTTSAFYAYLQEHPVSVDVDPDDEPAYSDAKRTATVNAYLVYRYGANAQTVEDNRRKNFYRLLGTSHINVETISHLHSLACIEVRILNGKDWNHTDEYGNPQFKENGTRYVIPYSYPMSGFNYMRSYHGAVTCLFEKNTTQRIPGEGPITMRRAFAQATDNMYYVPMERKMEKAKTAEEKQYTSDARDPEEQPQDKTLVIRHFVTDQGLWTGSLGGYVNFSSQLYPSGTDGIFTHTFAFDGPIGIATKLGTQYAIPIFAKDAQSGSESVEIDGGTVAVEQVASGEIIGMATINASGAMGWLTIQPYKRYVGRIFTTKF